MEGSPQPVSIVIPVHERSGLTRGCLDALLELDECAEAEIVVADDGSRDDTPEVVGTYGKRVRLLRENATVGFAGACNMGFGTSTGKLVVFLNNDTVPQAGWLSALLAYAADHERAAMVGSRLLFPNGTVQHAGIAICQDRFPRHLYAGFPADHPAVVRSRRLHAVSAACALVRRDAFERVGGFDDAYRNGLEDVDLCLRLEEVGYEIHYCGDSVVVHLESASRGERSSERTEGEKLYLRRWGDRVRPDDVSLYMEDGLIDVRYPETYPVRLRISGELATVEEAGRERELERLLAVRSRQAYDLLREATRLTLLAGRGVEELQAPETARRDERRRGHGPVTEHDGSDEQHAARLIEAHEELRRRDEELMVRICELQEAVGVAPSESFAYRLLPERLRTLVRSHIPAGRAVAVISKGDEELLRLDGRPARHFPSSATGEYTGYYPPDSAAATAHLAEIRQQGVEFLVIPATSLWWLDHYTDFGDHLRSHCAEVAREDGVAAIYSLAGASAAGASGRQSSDENALLPGMRALVRSLIPEDEEVLVMTGGDDALLDVGRKARPFPGAPAGTGSPPRGNGTAELQAARTRGVHYLIVPRTSFRLIQESEHVRAYLERCRTVALRDQICAIFELSGDAAGADDG